MDKIPILIIAPFFAPQTHAAMFRVHKLVKYLPQYGYKPIVITTDINYSYNENLELLKEFPKEVEIHRVKYIEPTMRGLRMYFGGKDRTFKSVKNTNTAIHPINSVNEKNKVNQKSFFKKIYSYTQGLLLSLPDAYWTWIHPATKEATALINKYNIKLMYTSVNPDSILKIGLNLKNKHDIKWVSDFRDPIGYGQRYNNNNPIIKNTVEKWIKDSMKKADILTGLSSSYQQIFKELYSIPDEKYVFIPTGLDERYLQNHIENKETRYLLFIGEFQTKYDDYLFKIISKSLDENKIKENFKIKFIGRKEVNEPIVTKLLSPYSSLNNIYEFIDHIPQIELYSKIKASYACILLSGGENFWWCNFAKMVDYIALNKKVLANVSNPSEARSELNKSNLGIFIEGNEVEDIETFSDFMNNQKIENNNNNDYYTKYLASSQVEEFSKLFDTLLKVKNER